MTAVWIAAFALLQAGVPENAQGVPSAQSQAAQSPSVAPPTSAPPSPASGPSGAGKAGDIGYFTAGNLVDRCQSSDFGNVSYCFAYITAVHDTMRAYEVWLDQQEFCVPANMAQADLRRAFLTYMSVYPTNRSGQAASVIVVALKQTYPCIGARSPNPVPSQDGSNRTGTPPR